MRFDLPGALRLCPRSPRQANQTKGGIMYVYMLSESDGQGHRLYTVGYYDPRGNWIPESDHEDKEAAARRVSFLNGGKS